jgi:hypothetical protein
MSVSASGMNGTSSSGSPSTDRAQPSPRSGRARPAEQDVRAMSDAFAAARRGAPQPQGRQPQQPLLPQGKGRDAKLMSGGGGEEKGATARADGLDAYEDPLLDRRDRQQDQGGAQGWAFSQALQEAPVVIPAAPSPQTDPAAFAQLLSQLWAQAKQKNEREVRVKFGPDAWPATGARMVRNAAGALDIQLQLGGGEEGTDLSGLADRLARSGVTLGSLSADAVSA